MNREKGSAFAKGGKLNQALGHLQKGIDVTPEMAFKLIEVISASFTSLS